MPFLQTRPAEARTPEVIVLPDQRKRLIRYFRLTQTGEIPYGLTTLPGTADPWPETAPTGFTGLYLTYKKLSDNTPVNLHGGKDVEPWVELTYEQIALTGETSTGGQDQTELTDGRVQIVDEWVQFSATTFVPQTINVSTATGSQGTVCYLFLEETEDDGTLRQIKRTYQSPGTVATDDELLNNGHLRKKSITSFHTVPATPTGYTRVGTPVQNPNGYPIYTYTFYSADPAASAGGEITRRYVNAQGGNVAFDLTSPNSSTGEVRCIITYLTPGTITTNPVTAPSGFKLTGVEIEDKEGYRVWTNTYGFGGGNEITVEVEGEGDGALVYTVTQNTANATTPNYPGAGTAYLVRLNNTRGDGFFHNSAVWKLPPADVTYQKTMGFEEPGIAEFVGSPPQFRLRPPKQRTLLVDVEVTFDVSQISDTPFSVDAYASFYETYTPTDTGVAVQTQRGLGGYLAESSGISGSASNYNGVLCTTWSASLISSIPSVFPTGLVVIKTDNEPYLTDTSGVQVFRRTLVSYTF